jgi:hypothetical protein
MAQSHARVSTDRPARYGKQLASHLGRKIEASWSDETGRGEFAFGAGTATVLAEPDALVLSVEGAPADLAGLEDVIGRHLVRFGARDELVIEWQRDNGEAGLVHRNEED